MQHRRVLTWCLEAGLASGVRERLLGCGCPSQHKQHRKHASQGVARPVQSTRGWSSTVACQMSTGPGAAPQVPNKQAREDQAQGA